MNVLIPAYKPDQRLLSIVDELHRETDYNIIVVNDGSGAEYAHIFQALPSYCTLLVHEVNRGKGAAMKTGFRHIVENLPNSDGVVIVDADGQHLLADIKRVVEAMAAHPGCLIIGSRKFTGKVPFRSRFGNSLTRGVFALASGVKLQDTQTGLRAIPMQYLSTFLTLKGDRYEYEMNMLLAAAEAGIPMHEVFIETVYIDGNESSHFHVIRDSLKIYAVICKFIFASLLSFGIDFVMLYVFKAATSGMADQATALTISIIAARAVSSLVNFFVNKKVVFKNKGSLPATIFKYYLLVAIVLLANVGLMQLLVTALNVPLFWSKIVTEVILFVFSYLMQRIVVFRPKRQRQGADS